MVQVLNGSGAVVQDYTYDAFGVEETPDEADTNPFRYAGEYYDSEAGLTYLRARYYAPTYYTECFGNFGCSWDRARHFGLSWKLYCTRVLCRNKWDNL